MGEIEIKRISILDVDVDVIVNAANKSLLGGGGVDGVIHRAAGPNLLEECRAIGACNPGEVRVTQAYKLPFEHIFHAVGPVWRGGNNGEIALLYSCYTNALKEAHQRRVQSIAFPAISTGAYSFPLEIAAHTAVQACLEWQEELPQRIVLAAIDKKTDSALRRALKELSDAP